ncbi:hypothetical protein N566_24805 [Streptomycetaceae bacterium MP113-05]|nr:hypothetical protein N566_24805 [Streptomycetaceae bacterium MP113-05]
MRSGSGSGLLRTIHRDCPARFVPTPLVAVLGYFVLFGILAVLGALLVAALTVVLVHARVSLLDGPDARVRHRR